MKELLLAILLMHSTGAAAAVKKWVDANGQIHYSDIPPASAVEAKTIRSSSTAPNPASPTGSVTGAPTSSKTIAEREAELKKIQQEKKADAEKAAKEQARAEALKENCNAAQQNLRVLQEGIRVVEVDSTGEQSVMDDERRQQNIAKVQKDISLYCK